MKPVRLLHLLCAALVSCLFGSPGFADTFHNPIVTDGADPWIVFRNGFYYYTQTTGNEVTIRRSLHITGAAGVGNATAVAVFTPPAQNNADVWAPELHFLQGKWYIYFAADNGINANHRLYVAEATVPDPQGSYSFKGKIYDATTDRWAIDGTVLEKPDGSLYLIWSGWPGSTDGLQNIYIAPMSDPWTISGPRVLISTPTYAWESWINEGPEVIQRNGKIFIFYAANLSWTDNYCLGLLVNTNGDVLNPAAWTKNPNPVFQKYSDASGAVYGPGHGSVVKSLDQNEDWLLYHAAKFSGAGWNRDVRTQKFTWNGDDTPNFGHPFPTNVALTVPSGEGALTAPFITTQPHAQTALPGDNVTFSVSANGTAPLTYQWTKNNSPISGATLRILTLGTVGPGDAACYSVIVSNAIGGVSSAPTTLLVNANARLGKTEVLWTLTPGQRNYLTTNLTERGIAYNPVSGNLLLASRAAGVTNIYVLDADTGKDLYPLTMDRTLVAGGTYAVNLIGAADDGAIYAGNLANSTPVQFRLYRWANDDPTTAPTLAYSGDPGLGNTQRWGDTMSVRGAGTNTQIILGSRNGTIVSVLTTVTGSNFLATPINISGVPNSSFGLGLAFGPGNTFFGKSTNAVLRKVSFDLVGGNGQVVQTFPSTEVVNSVVALGANPLMNVVGGIAFETPDNFKIYELSPTNQATQIATNYFATDNDNAFFIGAVDFAHDRVYALNPNNGILALRLLPLLPRINSIALLPGSRVRVQCAPDPRHYLLEGTPDLSNWMVLTNDIPTNGYLDALDGGASNRFYRLRVP